MTNLKTMNRSLWTMQILLAALFLFSGWMKVSLPLEQLTGQFPFPGWFVRFLGVAELAGAIGLILPWMLGIKPILTPLAASGLFLIMIGAVAFSLFTGGGVLTLIPFVVGIFAAAIAYGRW